MPQPSSPPHAAAPLALRDEWGEGCEPQNEPFDFDWEAITPIIPPLRVMVVEAIRHLGEPVSATDLRHCFNCKYSVGQISYYIRELVKKGLLVRVAWRQVRGATESFYYFYPRDFDPNR